MVEDVIEFIGFSKVEIVSFMLSNKNILRDNLSIVIGTIRPSYKFTFNEIIKNNKVALFVFEDNNIYLIYYENNRFIWKRRIISTSDLNDVDNAILIFKNLSHVQIASIKKVLNKKNRKCN